MVDVAEVERKIKKQLNRHTEMQDVSGIEDTMRALLWVGGVKKVIGMDSYSGSHSTKTLVLRQDPERDNLIVEFNSTNGSARFSVSYDKEDVDLPTLVRRIQDKVVKSGCVSRVKIGPALSQTLGERKEERYKHYEWFKTKWQELRGKEGISEWAASRRIASECGVTTANIYSHWYPKHVKYAQEIGDTEWYQETPKKELREGPGNEAIEEISLKEKNIPGYLFLYNTSDIISEDGEYLMIEAASSLLKKEFGDKEGGRLYEALKSAGVLIPQGPKVKGQKTFWLKDVPALTSRLPEKEEREEEPEVVEPEAILPRLVTLEKEIVRIGELSKVFSKGALRETLGELLQEALPEALTEIREQEQEEPVLGTSMLSQATENLRQEIQELREEIKPRIKEIVSEEVESVFEELERKGVSLKSEVAEAATYVRETADSLKQEVEEKLSQAAEQIQQEGERPADIQPRGTQDLFRLVTNLLTACLEDIRIYVPVVKLLSQRLSEEERKQFEEIMEQVPQEFLEKSD